MADNFVGGAIAREIAVKRMSSKPPKKKSFDTARCLWDNIL